MATKRKIPAEVKRQIYERDHGTCQAPSCELSRDNGGVMNIHHIRPEQFGGTEDPNNLILLCDIHHKEMHVEFSAYYEDSKSVLVRMNRLTRLALSRIRALFAVDDGEDLTPYLEFLSGNSSFRVGQLKTIRAALAGKDVLLVTPTGSGKSVCYQLPGLLQDKPSLVISPLKSLMLDQVESIWSKKVPATYINSDLATAEKEKRFEFIKQGLYKFIFVAPERFFASSDPGNAALYNDYSYLVVDEAHSIDAWGKAFRPSYSKLGKVRQQLGMLPTIALTASASTQTQEIITNSLNMHEPEVIVTGFYRDNIDIYKYIATEDAGQSASDSKLQYIADLLRLNPGQKTLIFVPTIEEGKNVQSDLASEYSVKADFYHGRLDQKAKMDIVNRFKGAAEPHSQILISTSAFGMGIDIPNIRHIVHWTPALSIEDYYQQIGRAGRDGNQSCAHLLYNKRDDGLLYYLASIATKQPGFKEKHGYTEEEVVKVRGELEKRVDQMLDLISTENGKEWNYIVNYFGETPLSFWEKHGKEIVDTGLVVILITIIPVSIFLIL